MSEQLVVATGLRFPEGPIALPNGDVLLVEIERGTLSRVTPEGEITVVAETGGGPNGAAMGPDGKVYICNNGGFRWHERDGRLLPGLQDESYSGGRIERVDLESGRVELLYRDCEGEPLKGPNDIVFDAAGGFWFTDHGKLRRRDRDRTGVFYARADGSLIREAIFPVDGPNGIGLSASGLPMVASPYGYGADIELLWSEYGVPEVAILQDLSEYFDKHHAPNDAPDALNLVGAARTTELLIGIVRFLASSTVTLPRGKAPSPR